MARTVFVIGAGASCDFNLPTGNKLRNILAKDLSFTGEFGRLTSGNPVIADAIQLHAKQTQVDVNRYFRAGLEIASGLPHVISIDNFLDQRRGDRYVEYVGKLGIAHAILDAERQSKLSTPAEHDQPDLGRVGDTWINEFFMLLTEGCAEEDLDARLRQVTAVIFNYDRCFEHFLYHALTVVYRGMSSERAAELVSRIQILHPYGTVGSLPWQKQVAGPIVGYGSSTSTQSLRLIALQGIKTFTESADSEVTDAIREAVLAAKKLFFLGFAYHEQNLRLLYPDVPVPGTGRKCYGTALGISAPNQNAILQDLVRIGGETSEFVEFSPSPCSEFVQSYSRVMKFRAH